MKRYTITGKEDGFGAQYQAIMSGIAYCNYMNYTYIHTPFHTIAHNENADELNKFIGIPEGNGIIDISCKCSSEVHNSKHPSTYYSEEVLQLIRNYYYSTDKPIIHVPDIAIHIRRGDVDETYTKRYSSNEDYNEIIDKLIKLYPNYTITIFSEGNEEDFKELKKPNVIFKLNGYIQETFHSLVKAKVLIIAKSSFSYSAALLNKNIIYYCFPFIHKPLDHWNYF